MVEQTNAEPATFCPPESRIFVLVAAILASSMGFIDGSVLSIATPAIMADLGASLIEAQWVSNAYMLMLAALLLIGGAAGDRFGLRLVFGLGIVLFVLASLGAAISPNAPMLIATRALQGIGAALMVPGSLAIIAKAYPADERGKAIGTWASASSLTTILGPVIGGLVLTSLGDWSWRLVFAINLPLGAIALGLLWFKVPKDLARGDQRLDLVGGVLVTLGLLAVALGLNGTGGTVPPLSEMLLWCGAGLVLLLAFLLWEHRAKQPMMPLRLFSNRAFAGANGLTFALYFALAAISFFLPITMIAGWGLSPASVSLVLLPLGLALTLLSPFSGRIADRVGTAPPIAAGAVLVALGFAGLGLLAPLHQPFSIVLPLMVLIGVGMGFVVSPLSTAVMTAVEDRETGIASGVNNAVARVAGLLAVALMGGLVVLSFAASVDGDGGLGFGQVPEPPLPSEQEARRVAATDGAFALVAYCTAALALLSALIAWVTLPRKPLRE